VDCDWKIATYRGDASEADRRTSVQLGQELGKGAALPGYILDQDGTYYFKGQTLTATPRGPRCGY
jgi:hypothetical protein